MDLQTLISELSFKASKSSGAGGQHVNKVSSRIEVLFNINNSEALNLREKEIILLKLKNRINKEQILSLSCEETRSQHRNKDLVTERLITLLKANLIRPKIRRATKPTKASVKRKTENKKRQSSIKNLRKPPKSD
ncbi:alternative ribosome rescue aminoacyl-tRNA hydrolase ArfB [Wenyingzhuangia sp. 2_MG-2023]|uniref:alternative ribosome rescue aminoacyl-tRNA hydrolase ArfB n=1 Tax=Wenyingzhuangia sp. 2_MG-2023 TaxID=3062639 RepID=UPI0026E15EB4|nr:alternative ribosome rescue aminoacyl-tRNA hydrolase ArfB [Wenyingzhuangia sp. 2_MG-2023]MDO6739185.1 alternative ribosome rescue aminoacyl-tRNA hydrolase ArfB [Wenyingzhuangia sp. 2_MG-2023]